MPKFIFIIFFFSTLFDWYNVKYGIRVFDVLIVLAVITYSISLIDLKFYNINYQIFFLLPGLALGLALAKVHHVSFFLFSFYIFFNLFLRANFNKSQVIKQIRIIIIIHLLFFILQYLGFYLFGNTFSDYREIFGMRPLRIWNEALNYFRPSGLYEEPNSYAVSLYMLIFLYYIVNRKIDFILIVGCISILLSQSLWGFGAVVVIISIIMMDKKLSLVYIALFASTVILLSIMNPDLILSDTSLTTYKRITNIFTDGSFIARYGIDFTEVSLFSFLVGHGIGVEGYHASLGGNGYAAIIFYFGVVGLLGFLLLFYRMASNISFFIGIVFILSTTPMIFYFIFWGWLALIYRYTRVTKYEFIEEQSLHSSSHSH